MRVGDVIKDGEDYELVIGILPSDMELRELSLGSIMTAWINKNKYFYEFVLLKISDFSFMEDSFLNAKITIVNHLYMTSVEVVKHINLEPYKMTILKLQMLGKLPSHFVEQEKEQLQEKEQMKAVLMPYLKKLKDIELGRVYYSRNTTCSYCFLGLSKNGKIGLMTDQGYSVCVDFDEFFYRFYKERKIDFSIGKTKGFYTVDKFINLVKKKQ